MGQHDQRERLVDCERGMGLPCVHRGSELHTTHTLPGPPLRAASATFAVARSASSSCSCSCSCACVLMCAGQVIHPIAANNKTDMFPPQGWDAQGVASWCQRRYHAESRPGWLPTTMGMDGGPSRLARAASHVIFTNGMQDPWSAQSITANASATLIAINIPDGSHHSDLGAPTNPVVSAVDSPTLKAARAQQLAILRSWLKEGRSP